MYIYTYAGGVCIHAWCISLDTVVVAVEVRKQTLYRKLILRKWRLKFPNDFDVIIDVVLDCLVYACKAFNGHSSLFHVCTMLHRTVTVVIR